MRSMSGMNRSQSAMEYLMTYGWAILIIAVVLAALFELGVFNVNNLGPRAQPGSCHVFRPDGPGTTAFINTEGLCSGELPEYVASFEPNSNDAQAGYGVSNTYIKVNTNFGGGNTAYTMTGWVSIPYYNPCSGFCGIPMMYYNPGGGLGIISEGGVGLHRGNSSDVGWVSSTLALVPNKWYFIAVSVDYPTYYLYQDNLEATAANSGNYVDTNPMYMGAELYTNGATFTGNLANIQLYNTSLSTNEIQALYLEGIGGAPIDLQNLVGWWPLNGNAQDYSGNNNNGQINGVTFTGSWTSGYSAP